MMSKAPEMEYGKAFTFVMEDPDWIKKLGIAALIVFVSLFGSFLLLLPTLAGFLLLAGYVIELTRRVINGEEKPLPEWTDFGNLFMKGLFFAIAMFVYSLPSILLQICGQSGQILPALAGNSASSDTVSMLATVATVLAACCGCLNFIYSIFIGMITPAVAGQIASKGSIGAAFDFNAVLGHLRAQPVVYLLVFLITSIGGGIIGFIGFLLCGIGLFVAIPYIMFLNGHLWGQAYRFTASKLEAPTA